MIIDGHCHLWERDMIPEKYWRATASMISQILPGSTVEQVLSSEIMQKSMYASADRLVGEMEKAGIDKTIVFGVDWGIPLGEPKINIEEFNKYVADSALEYPDKLVPFFTIDPRRKNAPEIFEEYLTKWEMKGLKLHPSTGYFPDGTPCYELYKIAFEYRVPIITHMGYIIGLKGKTARPEYFDAPTTDFPMLKFSFAHLNYGNIDELTGMMFMKPNIYCDISAHGQILMMNSPPDFYRQLRFVMNFEGVSSRIMFGSDWPITENIFSLARWVEIVRNLSNPKVSTLLENLGYKKFRSKEIRDILGKNAVQFLEMK
ncbi:MAG: amidohydrolase family protein [Candidatus Helarchaeota archaeon]